MPRTTEEPKDETLPPAETPPTVVVEKTYRAVGQVGEWANGDLIPASALTPAQVQRLFDLAAIVEVV